MAGLRKRREERALTRFTRALLLAGILLPGPIRAQEAGAFSGTLPGYLEVAPRIASLNGETVPLLGAAFVLDFSSGWSVAGGASFLMRTREIEDAAPLPSSNLDFSYWGVRGERWVRLGPDSNVQLGAGLMAGAASAQLRDRATNARLRADNSLLLEPSLSARLRALPGVVVGASAGYRFLLGVNGLEGIGARNLRGWSIGTFLRFGPI